MKRFNFILERIKRFFRSFKRKSISLPEGNKGGYVDFYKLAGSWFADIHSWIGDIYSLQMVSGADELLEYLSSGDHVVRLVISLKDNGGIHLEKIGDIYSGADYKVLGCPECGVSVVWLCGVNNFYWGGDAPENMWFKRIPYTDKLNTIEND